VSIYIYIYIYMYIYIYVYIYIYIYIYIYTRTHSLVCFFVMQLSDRIYKVVVRHIKCKNVTETQYESLNESLCGKYICSRFETNFHITEETWIYTRYRQITRLVARR
jgi:hypothetical protein